MFIVDLDEYEFKLLALVVRARIEEVQEKDDVLSSCVMVVLQKIEESLKNTKELDELPGISPQVLKALSDIAQSQALKDLFHRLANGGDCSQPFQKVDELCLNN